MQAANLKTFVAFDLETTGTDPDHDRILQLGAVRVENGLITAEYEQLVDPGVPIPLKIQLLTGIRAEALQGKPPLGEVIRDYLRFLGDLPLVAHHAPFDHAFLEKELARHGFPPLDNPVFDTAELARLACPMARNHRLGTLAMHLGISLTDAHQALPDARATALLYLRLLDLLEEMDSGLLAEICWLLEPTPWTGKAILRDIMGRDPSLLPPHPRLEDWSRVLQGKPIPSPPPPRSKPASPKPLDPVQMGSLLGPGGPFERAWPYYEYRPQQLQMLAAVSRSFNRGEHLLVEAGTGTGKSLGYLIPAIFWSVQNGEKVVVSTHTLNLQEQLWEKDLPALREVLDLDFRAALAKGRGNYLCLRRFEEARKEVHLLEPEERIFHSRLLTWLSRTQTGDRAELNLYGTAEEYWWKVRAESDSCPGSKCRWHRDACFVQRARRNALAADIVIANHSLLLTDLRTDNQVLPAYQHLVIDEAHHLEDVAMNHLGREVNQRELERILTALHRGARGRGSPGLLSRLLRQGIGVGGALENATTVAYEALQATGQLFTLLSGLVAEDTSREEEDLGRVTVRLRPSHRRGRLWSAVEGAGGNLFSRLRNLAGILSQGEKELMDSNHEIPEVDSLLLDLQRFAGNLSTAAEDLDFILRGGDEHHVCWMELPRGEGGSGCLRATPVTVAESLRQMLFAPLYNVVLTSATLSVGDSFEHMVEKLGITDSRGRPSTLALESPFDFSRQALLCLPDDLPNPREVPEEVFAASAAEFIGQLATMLGGRTLVLFTSHRLLRGVYNRLRPALEEAGLCTLAQGIDGSRSRLVEEFRDKGGSVLLGSSSFWEGVDIPGEGLSCVVIVRLPFLPPGLPVVEARMEFLERQGLSSFYHLSLPEAVLRFRQGFGRLIRRSGDRGAVVVLDQRLTSPRYKYGEIFIRSLPSPAIFRGPSGKVLARIKEWLG